MHISLSTLHNLFSTHTKDLEYLTLMNFCIFVCLYACVLCLLDHTAIWSKSFTRVKISPIILQLFIRASLFSIQCIYINPLRCRPKLSGFLLRFCFMQQPFHIDISYSALRSLIYPFILLAFSYFLAAIIIAQFAFLIICVCSLNSLDSYLTFQCSSRDSCYVVLFLCKFC